MSPLLFSDFSNFSLLSFFPPQLKLINFVDLFKELTFCFTEFLLFISALIFIIFFLLPVLGLVCSFSDSLRCLVRLLRSSFLMYAFIGVNLSHRTAIILLIYWLFMKCPSLFLIILVLWSVLSNITIATPTFCYLLFAWYIFFFQPCCAAQASQFPDQGLNSGPSSESAESLPLDHQGIPWHIFFCPFTFNLFVYFKVYLLYKVT